MSGEYGKFVPPGAEQFVGKTVKPVHDTEIINRRQDTVVTPMVTTFIDTLKKKFKKETKPEKIDLVEQVKESARERKKGVTPEVSSQIDRETKELTDDLEMDLFDPETGVDRTWADLPKLDNGRYGVLKRLGKGGMGGAWKVWRPALQDFGVVKEILPQFKDDKDLVDRFKREIVALDAVQSDYVVKPVDVINMSEKEGDLGIVMKFVKGKDLHEIVNNNFFDREYLPKIDNFLAKKMAQVLFGLIDLHKSGLVHRDLKLANVIDTKNGVKVIDLGLAGVQADAANTTDLDVLMENRTKDERKTVGLSHLTPPNSPMGTPVYSSPELLSGMLPKDPRGDLYSVGVMMYEILTGRYPIDDRKADSSDKSFEELFNEKIKGEITAPNLFRKDGEFSALEPIIMRLLRPNPDDRPETAKKTAELIMGAMVFNYPDVEDNEGFKRFFEHLGQSPDSLADSYKKWLDASAKNASEVNDSEYKVVV